MEPGWSALAFLIAAVAMAWFWRDSLAARESANAAALEACQRMGLQFLDGTVAFTRMAFRRDGNGRIALRRTYVFDYTADSLGRHQGFVVLLATRVESMGYAPGDADRGTPSMQVVNPALPSQASGGASVLPLEDLRSRTDTRSRDDADSGQR